MQWLALLPHSKKVLGSNPELGPFCDKLCSTCVQDIHGAPAPPQQPWIGYVEGDGWTLYTISWYKMVLHTGYSSISVNKLMYMNKSEYCQKVHILNDLIKKM